MKDTDIAVMFAAPQPFDTALYLGPGLADIALSLSGVHAQRLVAFCEAKTHRQLGAQTANASLDVASRPAIVSPSGTETQIHGYNVQGFASVSPATGLKELFPGLREAPGIPVETIPVQRALKDAGLAGTNNLLILGTSGCEADILHALVQSDDPTPFSRIILPLPALPLYEDSQDGAALSALLEDGCYHRIWETREDPDIPIAVFDLDHARLADRTTLAMQKAEISALKHTLEQLTSDMQEVRAQRDDALRSQAKAEADHKAALADANSQKTAVAELKAQKKKTRALETDLKALTAKTEQINQSLGTQHETAAAQLSALEAELEAAHQSKDKAAQELSTVQTNARQTETELASEQQKTAALSRQLAESDARLADLEGQVARAQTEIEAHETTTAALTEELNALGSLQTDLSDLHDKNKSPSGMLSEREAKVTYLEKQVEALEALKTQHGNDLTKTNQKVDDLQKAKDKADAGLAIALRIQALREADLDDLRRRYQSLHQEKDHLSALLGKMYHALNFLQTRKRSPKGTSKRS